MKNSSFEGIIAWFAGAVDIQTVIRTNSATRIHSRISKGWRPAPRALRGENEHGEEQDPEGGEGYAASGAGNGGEGKRRHAAAGGELARDTQGEVIC